MSSLSIPMFQVTHIWLKKNTKPIFAFDTAVHSVKKAETHLCQFEPGTVERMFQQLLNSRQHQVVVLLQEDLIAVTLLHFTSC